MSTVEVKSWLVYEAVMVGVVQLMVLSVKIVKFYKSSGALAMVLSLEVINQLR